MNYLSCSENSHIQFLCLSQIISITKPKVSAMADASAALHVDSDKAPSGSVFTDSQRRFAVVPWCRDIFDALQTSIHHNDDPWESVRRCSDWLVLVLGSPKGIDGSLTDLTEHLRHDIELMLHVARRWMKPLLIIYPKASGVLARLPFQLTQYRTVAVHVFYSGHADPVRGLHTHPPTPPLKLRDAFSPNRGRKHALFLNCCHAALISKLTLCETAPSTGWDRHKASYNEMVTHIRAARESFLSSMIEQAHVRDSYYVPVPCVRWTDSVRDWLEPRSPPALHRGRFWVALPCRHDGFARSAVVRWSVNRPTDTDSAGEGSETLEFSDVCSLGARSSHSMEVRLCGESDPDTLEFCGFEAVQEVCGELIRSTTQLMNVLGGIIPLGFGHSPCRGYLSDVFQVHLSAVVKGVGPAPPEPTELMSRLSSWVSSSSDEEETPSQGVCHDAEDHDTHVGDDVRALAAALRRFVTPDDDDDEQEA